MPPAVPEFRTGHWQNQWHSATACSNSSAAPPSVEEFRQHEFQRLVGDSSHKRRAELFTDGLDGRVVFVYAFYELFVRITRIGVDFFAGFQILKQLRPVDFQIQFHRVQYLKHNHIVTATSQQFQSRFELLNRRQQI